MRNVRSLIERFEREQNTLSKKRGMGDRANQAAAIYAAKLGAPFATLGISTYRGAISAIEYLGARERPQSPTDAVAERACRQIERYLEDPQWRFTLPLALSGSAFQLRVWRALAAIPVGESRTYGEIARALHTAPRAVGGACGANPIALVIPCHRVVARHGLLGGFMGVTEGEPIAIKRWLLKHEGYHFGA